MSDSSRSANRHRLLYALPAFVLALPTIPVFVLLPTFYAETMGLGLTVVGAIFLGLRLLDVISDPLIGWLSDRLPARHGRRKLPMLVGGLIGGPALIMLFSPPADVGAAYLIVWGALLYLAWTSIHIPYVTWAVELEADYHRRSALNAMREGAGLIGILATGAAGWALADLPELSRFEIIAWCTVAIGVAAFYLALRNVPEGTIQTGRNPLALDFPWKNRLFTRVLCAWFINGLANGLPAVCLPLFLTHIIVAGEPDKALLLFVYFLFAVLGIHGWVRLSGKFGKHRVWCLSMLGACLAFISVPLLSAGDIVAFGVICALTGLTLGSDLALPPAIQSDCADWDRLRFRKERTGTLFSYWSMSTKLALGLAVGIAFPTLSFFGLNDGAEDVPGAAKTALVVIYAVVPIVLKLSAVALMWNFPVTRQRHLVIQRALERRQC